MSFYSFVSCVISYTSWQHRLIDCNTGLSWAPRTTERTTTWKSLFRLRRVVCQSPIIRLSLYRTLLDNNNCNIHFAGCPQCGHCHQSPTLACPPYSDRTRTSIMNDDEEGGNALQEEGAIIAACQCKIDFYIPYIRPQLLPNSIYLSVHRHPPLFPIKKHNNATMPRIRLHPKPPNLATPIYHHNIHLPALIKDNVTVDCLLRRYLGRIVFHCGLKSIQ